MIAEKIGHQTRYPFLVISVANGGDTSMSCTRSGVAIPGEKSCAALYARLFVQGTATEIAARVNDLQAGRSLLDSVRERARRLEGAVGAVVTALHSAQATTRDRRAVLARRIRYFVASISTGLPRILTVAAVAASVGKPKSFHTLRKRVMLHCVLP